MFLLFFLTAAVSPAFASTSAALSALSSFSGQIFLPADQEFHTRKLVMNAACRAEPALIVVPLSDQGWH